MAKVENMQSVLRTLEHEAKKRYDSTKGAKGQSVIVGYTASYGIYVHENKEMKLKGVPRRVTKDRGKYWDPPNRGQHKFLEEPARDLNNNGTLSELIAEALKAGKSMQQALMVAGLRIQRESQKLVPVDTGNLKSSAFTRKE